MIHTSQRHRKGLCKSFVVSKAALPVKISLISRSTTGDICWAKVEVVNHGILSAVHQEMSSIPHLEKPPLEPGRSNEAGAEFGSTFENISGRSLKERIFPQNGDCIFPSYKVQLVSFFAYSCPICYVGMFLLPLS